MPHSKDNIILAGDVGGTKTNIGLFRKGKTRPVLVKIETYSSREADSLETIIGTFLSNNPLPINNACFGVAGPVVNGRCNTTNLPWNISENRIQKRFGLKKVRLINDLAATPLAIPILKKNELFILNKGLKAINQPKALIAPGTGLGMALLVPSNNEYKALPSEGGHSDFAPTNKEEVTLWAYLHKIWPHVSIERILSGPGLYNTYKWLRDSSRYCEPAYLKQMIKKTDPPEVITKTADKRQNPLCLKTLDMFSSILGAVAGNLALTGMTRGGVYLGGGIPPKILFRLKTGSFMESFVNKGRFRQFMKNIPVYVIMNDKAALLGAAQNAFGE